MTRKALVFVVLLAASSGVSAQNPDVDTPVLAAPAAMREGATVIKWKPDYTYDTLKKGTNRLVCYDRSGEPGQQPFSVQCTSIANLDRVAQNRKFEAMADKDAGSCIDAAEKDGTRVKPEFGSVWYTMSGPDQESTPAHDGRGAGRHGAVTRPARQQQAGRRVDHERGHVDGAPDDPGLLRPSRKCHHEVSKARR